MIQCWTNLTEVGNSLYGGRRSTACAVINPLKNLLLFQIISFPLSEKTKPTDCRQLHMLYHPLPLWIEISRAQIKYHIYDVIIGVVEVAANILF